MCLLLQQAMQLSEVSDAASFVELRRSYLETLDFHSLDQQ